MNLNEIENFRKKELDAINYYRSLHGVPALKMDNRCTNEAQAWASHLTATAVNGEIKHSNNAEKNLGECLAAACSFSDMSFAHLWYSEISGANFANLEENMKWFNMTQLIWKNSKKFGIGISKSPTSPWYYVVAQFDPCGNVLGHFAENVPPPLQID